MGLKDLFKKNLAKSEEFKQMQHRAKLQKMLEERSKSSNERELERFYEEEREKQIKKNLQEFRDHRQKESMETTVLGGKNMFKGKGNMMSGETTVIHNNDKLLSLKKGVKQKGMFFK